MDHHARPDINQAGLDAFHLRRNDWKYNTTIGKFNMILKNRRITLAINEEVSGTVRKTSRIHTYERTTRAGEI